MLTKAETNNAIVVRLTNVRKHPNADRLKLAEEGEGDVEDTISRLTKWLGRWDRCRRPNKW